MKLIHYNLIGGSSNIQADRLVGLVTRKGRWAEFIDRRIIPIWEAGVDRFWLHWPFGLGYGTTPIDELSTVWAQFTDARNCGATWLTADFVAAWSRFLQLVDRSKRPRPEIVCYLGRPYRDRTLPKPGTAQWWAKAWAALAFIEPALETSISIGIDAASGIPFEEPDFLLAHQLRRGGHRVYCESRPTLIDPRWTECDVVCETGFWRRSDPVFNADARGWALETPMIKGEIVRLISKPLADGQGWDDLSWIVEEAQRIRGDGHTVLTDLSLLRERGLLSQLSGASS